MKELLQHLKQRYPSVGNWRLGSRGIEAREQVPSFLHLLLHRAPRPHHEAPRCFVLPRRHHVAPLLSVVYGLLQFEEEFASLAQAYADATFCNGEHVLVRATGRVFVFRQSPEDKEVGRFRLGIVGQPGSELKPAISDVLRLEPTTRKRPQGGLDWKHFHCGSDFASLDQLLSIYTHGNQGLFQNRVLHLDHRAAFERFLAEVYVGLPSRPESTTFDKLLPFGSISEEGRLLRWEMAAQRGQPLIAVSPQPSAVAAACEQAEPGSLLVVVNGLRLAARDLAAFDRMSACQNVVLVAETQEEDDLADFTSRGCRCWSLEVEEIVGDLNHDSRAEDETSRTIFGPVFAAAHNARKVSHVECVGCKEPILEKAAELLLQASSRLGTDDKDEQRPGDPCQETLRRTYGLLMRFAGSLEPISTAGATAIATRITALRSDLRRGENFADSGVVRDLREALLDLELLISDVDGKFLGTSKAEALTETLEILQLEGARNIGFLVGHESDRQAARKLTDPIARMGTRIELIDRTGLTAEKNTLSFDALVCSVWPGSERFRRIVRQHRTPLLIIVGYAFERQWAASCWRQLSRRSAILRTSFINHKEKARWIGWQGAVPATWLPSATMHREEANQPKDIHTEIGSGFDIAKLEARLLAGRFRSSASAVNAHDEVVEARLVELTDGCHTWLTEGKKLPVVTNLLDRTLAEAAGSRNSVPMRTVEELIEGDAVIFRDEGQRDVIEAIADGLLKQQAASLRTQAARWQRALVASSWTANKLRDALTVAGVRKDQATLRSWLDRYACPIGPRSREDLAAVSKVTGDIELAQTLEATWQAIEVLRSAHYSAGTQLRKRLLEQLPHLLDDRDVVHIRITEGLSARMLRIKAIDPEPHFCPVGFVNKLLHTAEADGQFTF